MAPQLPPTSPPSRASRRRSRDAARSPRVLGRIGHLDRRPLDARELGRRGDRVRRRRRSVEAGGDRPHPRAGARRGCRRSRSDRRARRVRRAVHRSCVARQHAVRGQVSLGVRPVTSGDRRAPRRIGAPPPRHRGRPRLHGQGQRSGPVRGVVADPGTRSRRARARPRLGAHARRLRRARGQVGDPDRGDRREALFDRREHVGPRHRVRSAREPLDLAAGGAVHVDAQRQGRARASRATSSSGSKPGFR